MSTNRSDLTAPVTTLHVYDNYVVDAGTTRTEQIDGLSEAEQQQLRTWNDTYQDYPQDVCVPQLVARYATTTPDAVALAMGDVSLTYKELNQRANQLAHHLRMLGVRPNTLVGICVERSFEMIVGLLGILKAGGAYVPMDPTYPSERLSFMMTDAHISLLVTQQHLLTHLPVAAITVVCLDADRKVLEQESIVEPEPLAIPDDLVYVIYTSGSTGRPKGVQIAHKSLLNLVFWHQQAFAVTASDRATQLTSPAFDATGWEIWPYLTVGASIFLPDEHTRINPIALQNWLLHYAITITFLSTALAESIMTLEWPTTTALRFLLTGADMLHHYPPAHLPFRIVNNYGPTEVTVLCTSGCILPTTQSNTPPSIGRPIANVQVHILDETLREVPIGVPGELYIGGAGLAKGYLHQPALTAERFIPHPLSDQLTAYIYKTGDIARYLPDGQIAFLGRADQQIKIRGYRIEPNEIVTVLDEHPAVQTSVVIARDDGVGDKRLIAYLVPMADTRLKASSLRETLAVRLPDYMIPTTFVVIDALPLTYNGKIDHAALPTPTTENTLRDDDIVAPSTPIEERLAAIVAPLLGLELVGVDDNFFMLGGHSLLGTQLIVQIAETYGVELSLFSLFASPTIRSLASEIEQHIIAQLETMSEAEALRLLQ